MGRSIDLNADLGEGFGAWTMGDDEGVLRHVTSANVACGFHAGDPGVIDRTIALAVKAGVAVGAHPSHHDLRGFGRRHIVADPAEVEADVLYQVGAVLAVAQSHGVRLVHVKPHGAIPAAPVDADAAVVHAATGAQRRRLVALRADGTIGDAAFQRLETELDWAELGWAQVLPPEDRAGGKA